MKTPHRRPLLCLDFDGVIHSYRSGWRGAGVILDPPVPGAFAFIVRALTDGAFDVAIYSSRSNQPDGVAAMRAYCGFHLFNELRDVDQTVQIMNRLQWPLEKPPAAVTLDDRAITFRGVWPEVDDLRRFQPWTKGHSDLDAERRARLADILETVARDGLPGPRDLDVAIDAILAADTF